MDVLARIFKSVANETRLRLVESLLHTKEQTVESLSERLDLPYKTVSRNLKILEKAMMVRRRVWQGRVFYSIEDSPRLIYGKAIQSLIKKRKSKRMAK